MNSAAGGRPLAEFIFYIEMFSGVWYNKSSDFFKGELNGRAKIYPRKVAVFCGIVRQL